MSASDERPASCPAWGAAIVTGAISGIGRAVAKRFAAAGYGVCVNHHGAAPEAAEVVREIEWNGGRAIAVEADVSKEDDVARPLEEAAREFGRIDLLVANAGMQRDAPSCAMSLADWRAVIDVDLTGQFLCCREAVRWFRVQGRRAGPGRAAGSIVTMSSVHETIPWAGHINYATAKAGAAMMMRTLAQEVAGEGIRINSVAPGAIRTPINVKAWGSEAALEKLLRLVPYGRIGESEDVAEAVAWLASDAADYVVGTTLTIDGGMSLHPEFRNNG